MKMKRMVGMALVVMLMLTCMLAKAEEPLSFTITSTHSQTDMDYNTDVLYKFISQKFDFTYEVWPVSKDSHDEKVRIWINAGTMPDVLCWRNFNYQDYALYVEQGLLKALPEGWETTYPDLFEMYQACGIYDMMAIDGVFYGIPHSSYYRFANMSKPIVQPTTLYYRKDWANKLGFNFEAYITMSELESYLQACIENDMAGNGNTLGLSESPLWLNNLFMMFSDYNYFEDEFYLGEDGYNWIMNNGKIAAGVNLARSWYQKGLIDPDYYLLGTADATANFTSGLSAAMFNSCSIPSHYAFRKTFEETTNLSAENIGLAAIAADDGTVMADQADNFWSCTFFSPELSDEELNRILEIMNWCCTEEGELTIMVGLQGEAWDYDADGSIKILLQPDADGAYKSSRDLYPSYQIFRAFGVVPDDYSFLNPSFDPDVVQSIVNVFKAKQSGKIIPIDYNYKFFASDAKADYSVDIKTELTYLIITPDLDVDAEIEKFVQTNAGLWQPVVDDLNAALLP